MITSALNEGVRGLQAAQRDIQKSAQEIANSSLPQSSNALPQNPEDAALPPVNQAPSASRVTDISEPVVELKRGELLFSASAQVVSVADQTLGSLLDVKA